MDLKHEIIGLKDQGDKNHVDENVSNYGKWPDLFRMVWVEEVHPRVCPSLFTPSSPLGPAMSFQENSCLNSMSSRCASSSCQVCPIAQSFSVYFKKILELLEGQILIPLIGEGIVLSCSYPTSNPLFSVHDPWRAFGADTRAQNLTVSLLELQRNKDRVKWATLGALRPQEPVLLTKHLDCKKGTK